MGTPADPNDTVPPPANGDTPPGETTDLPPAGSPDDVEKKSDVTESDRQIEEGDEKTA